jgi:uncharacterized protein
MGDGNKPHTGNSNSRPFGDEEREITLAPTEPRTFDGRVKPIPEAELLSCEAIAAVGSAIRTLAETVKKHDPPLEHLVRETLRPVLKSWLDDNLPPIVGRMVQAELERAIRGR